VAVGTVKKSIEASWGRDWSGSALGLRGRRFPVAAEVLGDGRLGDLEAELAEFTVDARCAPERVGRVHLPNQCSEVRIDGGPASGSWRGSPLPVERESASAPADDGVRSHDVDGASPAWPEPGEQRPEHPIGGTETRPLGRLALEDGQLMAHSEDCSLKLEARPKRRAERGEQRDEQGGHRQRTGSAQGRICNENKTFRGSW